MIIEIKSLDVSEHDPCSYTIPTYIGMKYLFYLHKIRIYKVTFLLDIKKIFFLYLLTFLVIFG